MTSTPKLALASLLVLSVSVVAEALEKGQPSTHFYKKRELSDSGYNRYAIVHATVGSIATMLIFPFGVVGARGLRILTARWWWMHAVLQGIFGFGCLVVSFALAIVLVGDGDHFSDGHRRTGLVLFILVFVQVTLGIALKGLKKTRINHPEKAPGIKGHPWMNIIHILIGLAILGLGWWQTWSGFALINKEAKGLQTPLVISVLWGVLVGIFAFAYAASWFWIPYQLRLEEQRRYGGTKLPEAGFTSAGSDVTYVASNSPMVQSNGRNFATSSHANCENWVGPEATPRNSTAPLIDGRR